MNNARFLINPSMTDPLWTPEPWQMLHWPNASRLNALWLGLVAPIVMLPGRAWHEVLRPLFSGELARALRAAWFIPVSTLTWAWYGLRGQLSAAPIPREVLHDCRVLSVDESMSLLLAGVDDFIIDTTLPPPSGPRAAAMV